MPKPVITISNIVKDFKISRSHKKYDFQFFGKHQIIHALKDVSFEVFEGEVFGIIGRNGSGKSTLLRLIAGLYSPKTGNIDVQGTLAPLLHLGSGLRNELTTIDNIILAGMLMGFSKEGIKQRVDKIIKFAELEDFVDLKLRQFSNGMRARLAFSIALEVDPDILLVDEILAVGDASFRKKSFDAFLSFKNQKKTIVYASHNLKTLEKLCDRVILLEKGQVIIIDKPSIVLDEYKKLINNLN